MPHPVCVCLSVYLCQGGVRRQLRFHIAPRKRLELEACYNAKYTHTYMHTYKKIYGDARLSVETGRNMSFVILFLMLL